MIDEIVVDYDNKGLAGVRWQGEWLCQRFYPLIVHIDLYRSSENSYHLVLKLSEAVERNVAMSILRATGCDEDYVRLVERRGFIRRVSSKKNAPKPRLMESWSRSH